MSERTYWQSIEEREGALDPALEREFPTELPLGPGSEQSSFARRDFFRVMGLSAAAAMAACQRAPAQKVVPFVKKPEELTPGVPLYYASTCAGCGAGCGLLVKTRDGRPIKVEGNEAHPLSGGGVCATGQASVLSLYDASRARGPSSAGRATEWPALDSAVRAGLASAQQKGKGIRLLLPWVIGPSAEAAVARFLSAFPSARAVRHESLPTREPIARAHHLTHGRLAVPDYHFEQAKVIVSFAADFLGTWLSPVAFTRQYRQGRSPDSSRMSRHLQLEPAMSLTGSNADRRFPLAPSDIAPALAGLVSRLAARANRSSLAVSLPASELPASELDRLAEELWAARGEALVVCGAEDLRAQLLCNAANELLGAYGKTLSLEQGVALESSALSFGELMGELRAGSVGALLVVGANPVYSHPEGAELAELLGKVELTVSTADRLDETAQRLGHHAPEHNFLEDWADAEPRRGLLSLRQPAVAPLFQTRNPFESLLRWAGVEQSFYDVLRARWEQEVFPRAGAPSFQDFFDGAVQQGAVELPRPAEAAPSFLDSAFAQAVASAPARARRELEPWLYQKVALRDGALGNNGWLHELPDPITKATWGNYAQLSPELASAMRLSDGRLVTVSAEKRSLSLPALVQPGLHPRVVAVAVGYGRTRAGSVGDGVGANAFPVLGAAGVKLSPGEGKKALAFSQTHHSQEGREIVREETLAGLLLPRAKAEKPHHRSLWSGHPYPGRRWAMVVDLSACTGCSACVVSCQAENNIPVVGEDEVRRRREMHWLRIDRYYAGAPENPTVVHQPMMCLHCENAPCETVCPVLATVHSKEGLNQQVYNRCVGTRYCANNCPPKVRRFNWFEYPHADPLERMVLNPEVAVRSRGVMEKCSMCVQRIEEAKARARREGRQLAEGEIRTACQQSCPAQAIHFGDLNDQQSEVARLASSTRSYRLLEELNIGSSVHYLSRVRNTGEST